MVWKLLDRFLAPMTVALIAPLALHAQELSNLLDCRDGGPDSPSVGIYSLFLDSGRPLCIAPEDDSDGTFVPCYRIGEIHVGQERSAVEALLGAPWQTLPGGSGGGETQAYLLFRDETADRGAYYVIEYESFGEEEIVFSLQVTGNRPDPSPHFSCLHLGDPASAVQRQLGKATEVTPFSALGGSLSGLVWSFDLPISIEFIHDDVYSLRVWRPFDVAPVKREWSTP